MMKKEPTFAEGLSLFKILGGLFFWLTPPSGSATLGSASRTQSSVSHTLEGLEEALRSYQLSVRVGGQAVFSGWDNDWALVFKTAE